MISLLRQERNVSVAHKWAQDVPDEMFVAINISSERQEKLGVSNWVEVPVEQGLTNHSYRVLQP